MDEMSVTYIVHTMIVAVLKSEFLLFVVVSDINALENSSIIRRRIQMVECAKDSLSGVRSPCPWMGFETLQTIDNKQQQRIYRLSGEIGY